MKKGIIIVIIIFLLIIGLVFFFVNKSNNEEESLVNNANAQETIEQNDISNISEEQGNTQEGDEENMVLTEQNNENTKLKLNIDNHELTATLYDNSSVDALVEALSEGPITINMSDYANMEKVGSLGMSLPQNNEDINTEVGDLILYQGNSFVIYYSNNSWSLTRLGKIDNITGEELIEILGDGDVTVTLSID